MISSTNTTGSRFINETFYNLYKSSTIICLLLCLNNKITGSFLTNTFSAGTERKVVV